MSFGRGRSPCDTGPREQWLDVKCPGTLAASSRRTTVLAPDRRVRTVPNVPAARSARASAHTMRHVSAFGSVGLDHRFQRGEVLHYRVGVTLELLIGHLRTLPKCEDHFAPIAIADDP
jgi:hypothetical protein